MEQTTAVRAIADGVVPCPEGWQAGARLLGARWNHLSGEILEAVTGGFWYFTQGNHLHISASFSTDSVVVLRWELPEVVHG